MQPENIRMKEWMETVERMGKEGEIKLERINRANGLGLRED